MGERTAGGRPDAARLQLTATAALSIISGMNAIHPLPLPLDALPPSRLHRLDARVKVAVAVALISGVMLTPSGAPLAYPLLLVLVAGIAHSGGLPVVYVWRAGSVALPFTVTAAALLFTVPGPPLVRVLGVAISAEGLARFLSILMKSWLAAQIAVILARTTTRDALLQALRWWRMPQVLVEITALMLRYLGTLQDEARRLIQARAARSATPDGQRHAGGWRWQAQVAGGMVGSLFLRSLARSERVYAAMRARGYTGTLWDEQAPPLPAGDVLLGGVALLVLLAIQLLAAAVGVL